MHFIYHEKAGEDNLLIKNETFKYIFKVRRANKNETFNFRNLEDKFLYNYEVKDINKKNATLVLKDKQESHQEHKSTHIAWCIVDPKTIEKTIPFLNEFDVAKITFVYSSRSQKNFKPNLEKLKKIAINSSGQCGRDNIMEFEILENLKELFNKYNNIAVLDFGGEIFTPQEESTYLVGPEGGFSDEDKRYFTNSNIFSFDTKLTLRSESALIRLSCL